MCNLECFVAVFVVVVVLNQCYCYGTLVWYHTDKCCILRGENARETKQEEGGVSNLVF